MLVVPVLLLVQGMAVLEPRDSTDVLRDARNAQARFEFTRRNNLPSGGGPNYGRCDEYIGRFCFWYGDPRERRTPREPPPEPAAIGRARERLLGELDRAAALLPGDDWIAGQRVHYLLEAGRHAAAAAVARLPGCRATAWWCAALAGSALHASGDYAAADSAFARALAGMPEDERCRWTNIAVLLRGELAKRYERQSCAGRIPLADRLWWLARPLYLIEGNDRRTEHYTRVTVSRIVGDARSPWTMRWGDDLHELTLRYDWPIYWTRRLPSPGSMAEPAITGHDPDVTFHFLPESADSAPAWDLEAERPSELYAPAYATAFVAVPHQLTLFRQADSCLVVVTFDIGGDTGFARSVPVAALALARDERAAPVVHRVPLGRLVATTACEPQLVSLELLSRETRRAARARYVVRPPSAAGGEIAISDLLLFQPTTPLPHELDAVLPYLHGAPSLPRDATVGLYWELYDAGAGETVDVAVTVTPERGGWLRRATTALGLTRRRAAKLIEWQELVPDSGGGRVGRSLVVDLAGLEPGRYVVEVAVAGRGSAVARREITIER